MKYESLLKLCGIEPGHGAIAKLAALTGMGYRTAIRYSQGKKIGSGWQLAAIKMGKERGLVFWPRVEGGHFVQHEEVLANGGSRGMPDVPDDWATRVGLITTSDKPVAMPEAGHIYEPALPDAGHFAPPSEEPAPVIDSARRERLLGLALGAGRVEGAMRLVEKWESWLDGKSQPVIV